MCDLRMAVVSDSVESVSGFESNVTLPNLVDLCYVFVGITLSLFFTNPLKTTLKDARP